MRGKGYGGDGIHLGIDLFVIYAVKRWADWRNWRQYHATMVFIGAINIVYNYISSVHDTFLWWVEAPFLPHTVEEIIHSFLMFPGVVLIFLSRRLVTRFSQGIYILKWVSLGIGIEWVFYLTERINYQYGWNIWHSLVFDCILFFGILLHHEKPLQAYGLFILVTGLGIWAYKIPL